MAVALVVAAGSGERLGADRPKAFAVLAGRPMLEWSIDALREAGIDDVVVALPLGYEAPDGARGVPGGATRSASVRNALAATGVGDPVVVHDAARPLITPALIRAAVLALDEKGCDGAVLAEQVRDTVKVAREGWVEATLDRSNLWAVQTPQVFRRAALSRALDVTDRVLASATDDASLVEYAGGPVWLVPSSPENFKVTTPHDLRVAEMLLRDRC